MRDKGEKLEEIRWKDQMTEGFAWQINGFMLVFWTAGDMAAS